MAQPRVELFLSDFIKKFRHVGSWVAVLRDESRFVGNNVIHKADLGADPAVTINGNAPFLVTPITDDEQTYSLDRFDTENTPITDEELYASAYDKISSVVERHTESLEEETAYYGLHYLAPPSNSTVTPVLLTTGADDGTGRKRLTIADVIRHKRQYDDLKIPKRDRHLVLSNEHVEDLLLTSESFEKQYMDVREGRVLKLKGFNIHEEVYSPRYNRTTLAKVAYGAAASGTDGNASTSFWAPDALRAKSTPKFYYRPSSLDPENRQTVAGFRVYHLIAPYKRRSQGAIVSAAAA